MSTSLTWSFLCLHMSQHQTVYGKKTGASQICFLSFLSRYQRFHIRSTYQIMLFMLFTMVDKIFKHVASAAYCTYWVVSLEWGLVLNLLGIFWTFNSPLTRSVNCGLRMCRECWHRFLRHRFQSKPLVIDPDRHYGTCVTHMPWCLSGSLTLGSGKHVPGIPGECANRNFTYLTRGP